MKKIDKKITGLCIGSFLALAILSCSEPEIIQVGQPTARIEENRLHLMCVGSSTAEKREYSMDDMVSRLFENPTYMNVLSTNPGHEVDKGFEFEASLTAINTAHQHGVQKIPFLIKDSMGVYSAAQQIVEVFIEHDTTPPTVIAGESIGTIPFGIAISSEYLKGRILADGDLAVNLNPCALATSQAITVEVISFERNPQASQTYPITFKVIDIHGIASAEASINFTLGENVAGVPEVRQKQNLTINRDNFNAAEIIRLFEDDTYIEITSKNGYSNAEVVSGIVQPPFYDDTYEVIVQTNDQANLSVQNAIVVEFDLATLVGPTKKASFPADSSIVASTGFKRSAFSEQQRANFILEELKKVINTSSVTLDTPWVDANYLEIEILSENFDETRIGEYDISIQIFDSIGTPMQATPLAFKFEVLERPAVPEHIQKTVTVDGKVLFLTHFDDFTSLEILQENWDIGNPGYGYSPLGEGEEGYIDYTQYNIDSGNPGIPEPTFFYFDDGIPAYEGDRYKQPSWSPKAVKINDAGELEIQVYWDPDINNPSGYATGGSTKGYGLSGAIHSKRQFPSGFFVTRVRHKTGKRAVHWDAFWGESNNPFSRLYGQKPLFMPPGGETRERIGFADRNENVNVKATDKGLNGEQMYEWDAYEWVENGTQQYHVMHAFAFYGAYTGNEDKYRRPASGTDMQLWMTEINAYSANLDNKLGSSFSDGGRARDGEWSLLMFLHHDGKIQFWNAADNASLEEAMGASGTVSHQRTQTMGMWGNPDLPYIWPADSHKTGDERGYAPIQIKFSSELGQWNNAHNMIYNIRDTIKADNPDIMFADYFAFYAWDVESFEPLD